MENRYAWKTISREEIAKLNEVHRVATLRGQFKAKPRAIKLQKRAVQYQRRYLHEEQVKLAGWYLRNFP